MKPNGIPETDAEADALRAYLPTEKLAEMAKIRDEEIREADEQSTNFRERCATVAAIKERMKKDRATLKKLEAADRSYFGRQLFVRTDAAREAAWIIAAQLRREALARGEAPRFETCAQCSARQKINPYTP